MLEYDGETAEHDYDDEWLFYSMAREILAYYFTAFPKHAQIERLAELLIQFESEMISAL